MEQSNQSVNREKLLTTIDKAFAEHREKVLSTVESEIKELIGGKLAELHKKLQQLEDLVASQIDNKVDSNSDSE